MWLLFPLLLSLGFICAVPQAGGGSSTDLIILERSQQQNDREALLCLAVGDEHWDNAVQPPLHRDPAVRAGCGTGSAWEQCPAFTSPDPSAPKP